MQMAAHPALLGARVPGGRAARPGSSGERIRITGPLSTAPARTHCVRPQQHLPRGSPRGAGGSLQCAASYAAAAWPGDSSSSGAAPAPPAAQQQQQQQQGQQQPRQSLLPPWAANVARLAGMAAAFVAWYNLASALGGPFASLSLAAAAPANEGAGGGR